MKQSVIVSQIGHKQEICGLKWSPDGQQLASGGNDNFVKIWNIKSNQAEHTLRDHKAAIKALEWSPHQHGLLLSGGGTRDMCIKFWNTKKYKKINELQIGSQICGIQFSNHYNEFVCAHGFSDNAISIWNYPQLQKIGQLQGHDARVLYMTMSPDGQTIATGAGDETLKFWKVFP